MTDEQAGRGAAGGAAGAAGRVYTGLWRVLVDWFRVPDLPPTLPAAPGEQPEAFKPATGFLGYLKLWFWIVVLALGLALLVGGIAVTVAVPWLGALLSPVALAVAIVPGTLAYIGVHLRYDTTWYVLTRRSLRIRRGIWIIHEMTITFENVQNVKVQQGPVQRLFGISNLIVETAGGGGDGSGKGHGIANRGVLEGIESAEHWRDVILSRLRMAGGAGLGDEAPDRGAAAAWTPAHLRCLREIRAELAALGTSPAP